MVFTHNKGGILYWIRITYNLSGKHTNGYCLINEAVYRYNATFNKFPVKHHYALKIPVSALFSKILIFIDSWPDHAAIKNISKEMGIMHLFSRWCAMVVLPEADK